METINREILRVASAGSVDDGKSTLLGRLLLDARAVADDQQEAVRAASQRRGKTNLDTSLLTDGLRAERERGITIDVAYRYFSTPKRVFILADTPGHAEFTRNMVTGASTADVALILTDASRSVTEQTRRHAAIAALLGVRHIFFCVNKMDAVGYSQDAFERRRAELEALIAPLDMKNITYIPLSALTGDNVASPSENMPWHGGAPLLTRLEALDIAEPVDERRLRLPVQCALGDHFYAGRVAGGALEMGAEALALPGGQRVRILSLAGPSGPIARALPGLSVVVQADVRLARGDLLASLQSPPTLASRAEADLCWLGEAPLKLGATCLVRHTARTVTGRVAALTHMLDLDSLTPAPAPETLRPNDIARVTLAFDEPLALDTYAENRATGSLILIDPDTKVTVAAAMVR